MSEMNPITPQIIPPAPGAADAQAQMAAIAKLQLQAQVKNAANWFYWIAGLSMVNTVVSLTGSQWHFILGLGITQIVDAVANGLGSAGHIIGFVINVFIAGMFVMLGVLANKRKSWAFILGLLIFALDTLIYLMAVDVIGIIFHIYVLYVIFTGYRKLSALIALDPPPRQGF